MKQVVWFTSDLHFGHKNVIEYAKRPFANVDEMNATMISNWNARVQPEDTVYIVGDFALCNPNKAKALLKELNGSKRLVRGNHDKWVKDSDVQVFDWVKDLHTVKVEDPDAHGGVQRIVLCHYAMRVWDQRHRGAWHLYGHSHGSLPDDKKSKSFDIGVDNHGFKPLSYDEVKALMADRGNDPVDHHGLRDE